MASELPLKHTPSLGYNNLSYSPTLKKFIYTHKGEVHVCNAGSKSCSSFQLKGAFQARVCGDFTIAVAANGANFFDLNGEKALFTVPFAEEASRDTFLSRGIAVSGNQAMIGHSSGAISVLEVSADKGSYSKTLVEHKDGITDITSGSLGGAAVFVSADMAGEVIVWDAASLAIKARLTVAVGDTCTSVGVCGDFIVCGYGSGHVRLFNADGSKAVEIAAHARWIQAIAVDPANSLAASVAEDQVLQVWSVGKKVALKSSKVIKDALLTGVQFTGDGNVAVVAYDNDRLQLCPV